MNRTLLLVGGVVAWTSGSANTRSVFVEGPAAGHHTTQSECPAPNDSHGGTNELIPDPVRYLSPPLESGPGAKLFYELRHGDTPFPGWTFRTGEALNGTLTIDDYHSRFVGEHRSGGQIEIRYNRIAGEPENLRWIQMIMTDDPLGGAISPYIDPFPSDDPLGQDLPFYYTQAEIPDHTNGKDYDLHFYDFSKRVHLPDTSVSWRADLYLASWDEQFPPVVWIHDGIRWGWNAQCTGNGCYKCMTLAPVSFSSSDDIAPGVELRLTADLPASMALCKVNTCEGVELLWADIDVRIDSHVTPDGVSEIVVVGGEGQFDAYVLAGAPVGISSFNIESGGGSIKWETGELVASIRTRVDAVGFVGIRAHASGSGWVDFNNNAIELSIGTDCSAICEIPTVTGWALVVITLLLLTGAKVCFGRRWSGKAGA